MTETTSALEPCPTCGALPCDQTLPASTVNARAAAEFCDLAEKATRGPVDFDTIDSDGAYGVGDDCRHGFSTYAVVDANGKTIVDALNSDVGEVHEEHDEDGTQAWDQVARQNAAFIAWCFNHRAEIAAALKHFATPAQPAPAEGSREAAREAADFYAKASSREARRRALRGYRVTTETFHPQFKPLPAEAIPQVIAAARNVAFGDDVAAADGEECLDQYGVASIVLALSGQASPMDETTLGYYERQIDPDAVDPISKRLGLEPKR